MVIKLEKGSLKIQVLDKNYYLADIVYEDAEIIITEKENVFTRFKLDSNYDLVEEKIHKSEAMYYIELAEEVL